MKSLGYLLLSICLFNTLPIKAQAPYWAQYDWKSYQEGSDVGNAITSMADGMLLTIGSKCNQYQDDCFKILRLSNEGEILWSYCAAEEGALLNTGIGMKPLQYEGAYYIPVNQIVSGNSRAYLFIVDSTGNTTEQLFTSEGRDYIRNADLIDNGILTLHEAKVNDQYHIIVRYSNTSGQVFKEIIHENGFSWEGLGSIAALPDSGYVYTNQYAQSGAGQAILGRRNYEGEILWQYIFPPEGFEGGNRVIASSDGQHLYFSTRRYDPLYTQGDGDYLVECYDIAGNFEWRYVFTYGPPKEISNIQLAANGDIIGCGAATVLDWQGESGNIIEAATLFRLNPQGELLWERYFTAQFPEYGYSFRDLCELSDGRIAAVGYYLDTLPGGFPNADAWLVVTDSTGCLTPDCGEQIVVASEEPQDGLVRGIREVIFRVSPNPATEVARIEWLRTPSRYAQLTLHDATGRLVQQISASGSEAPETINLRGLPSGLFFLTLRENGYVRQTERLIKN